MKQMVSYFDNLRWYVIIFNYHGILEHMVLYVFVVLAY